MTMFLATRSVKPVVEFVFVRNEFLFRFVLQWFSIVCYTTSAIAERLIKTVDLHMVMLESLKSVSFDFDWFLHVPTIFLTWLSSTFLQNVCHFGLGATNLSLET